MPLRGIRAHYEQLSEFERGRIIELKEAGWENRRIARYMGRGDAAIRRCWQEWVEDGRFQCHDGSGRSRATADWEDRLIVRSAVTASDPSLSTIRRTTRT
ncbi:HTH_Tnp_Tc3_2 domain-containing protein [Trichonephila clavipes]|nr:HTH_Tnp_Tc3_2 domain-containing protein [Trichonephila clavipes]